MKKRFVLPLLGALLLNVGGTSVYADTNAIKSWYLMLDVCQAAQRTYGNGYRFGNIKDLFRDIKIFSPGNYTIDQSVEDVIHPNYFNKSEDGFQLENVLDFIQKFLRTYEGISNETKLRAFMNGIEPEWLVENNMAEMKFITSQYFGQDEAVVPAAAAAAAAIELPDNTTLPFCGEEVVS